MPFLAFEGLDGSGKSTLIKEVYHYLESKKIPAVKTREPGGTSLGESVRKILLQKKEEEHIPSPMTELFLYQACRRQNVDKVVIPSLKEGKWVLTDRFWASTYAFQAGGRGIDESVVLQTCLWASQGAQPDLWVFLDLTLEEAQKRWEDRTLYQPLDRFELENTTFHKKVRTFYSTLSKSTKYGSWLVLDATLPKKELLDKVVKELEKKGWLK